MSSQQSIQSIDHFTHRCFAQSLTFTNRLEKLLNDNKCQYVSTWHIMVRNKYSMKKLELECKWNESCCLLWGRYPCSVVKMSFRNKSKTIYYTQNNITLVLLLPSLAKCACGEQSPQHASGYLVDVSLLRVSAVGDRSGQSDMLNISLVSCTPQLTWNSFVTNPCPKSSTVA